MFSNVVVLTCYYTCSHAICKNDNQFSLHVSVIAQLFTCDPSIIPRQLLTPHDNALLVAFTRKYNGITCLGMSKSSSDCLCAVSNTEKILPLLLASGQRTLRDLAQNLFPILFTRVFISNNEEVCHLCRNLPHYRTFLYVTLTRGAENGQQLARGHRAQGRQNLCQAIRRMRIIDNHGKWLSLVNALHAACYALHLAQSLRNRRDRHSLAIGRGNGGKAIAHIETPDELRFDHILCIRQNNAKACTRRSELHINRTHGCYSINAIV